MVKDAVSPKRVKPLSLSSKSKLSSDVLALSNLLPAGTLSFALIETWNGSLHSLSESWCELPGQDLVNSCLSRDTDLELLDAVYRLIEGYFICVTCRVAHSSLLLLRIYLIPYDLPNVNGALHTRPEASLSQGRKLMKRVLTRISRDKSVWDGKPHQENGQCSAHVGEVSVG